MRWGDDGLWSEDPAVRVSAAASMTGRRRARLLCRVGGWPPGSTGSAGAVNAWLLLVSTKPPVWSEPLVVWRDHPPVLGHAHAGFFHPDPLGCWSEVRRWANTLLAPVLPGAAGQEALAITALLHMGSDPGRLEWARRIMRPAVVLFLDGASSEAAGRAVTGRSTHAMVDPHRLGQRYEGWWATEADGTIVGKAPQHPAAQRLYRPEDLTGYLGAAPLGRPGSPGGSHRSSSSRNPDSSSHNPGLLASSRP